MTRKANCRQGRHSYGRKVSIGAGMARKSCSACGRIKLNVADPDVRSSSVLFTRPRPPSMFWVELVLNSSGTGYQMTRSFGRAPDQRRRPLHAVA